MKRFLSYFVILAVVLLGCNISTTVTQGVTPQAGVTDTEGSAHKPTGTPTVPLTGSPAPATNASCNELTFYLDPNLASSYQCETIPESGGAGQMPFITYPQYTKISLVGYPISDRMMQPVISVFPVQRFSELLPDMVNLDVAALQALIGGGVPGNTDLPLLPLQNARQLFLAQYAVVKFQNGSGIHYVTQYAQAYVPVNNHEMFFSFQGMTSDGKYWISIILPISHPSLSETEGDPSSAEWATINSNPDAYYAQKATDLNAKLPKSFIPSIVMLNALINSMTIQP